MKTNGKHRFMAFLGFMILALGCTQEKSKKFEHNGSHNLFLKSEFLEKSYSYNNAPKKVQAFLEAAGFTEGGARFEFAITEDYLYLKQKVDGDEYNAAKIAKESTHQWSVAGHYDVVDKRKSDGSATRYVEKSDSKNLNWSERSHFEAEPFSVSVVELPPESQKLLYSASQFKDKDFSLEELVATGAFKQDLLNAALSFEGESEKNTAKLRSNLSKEFLHIFTEKNGVETEIYRVPVQFYTVHRPVDEKQQPQASLSLRGDNAFWQNAGKVKISKGSATVISAEQLVVSKKSLTESCFRTAEEIPFALTEEQSTELNYELENDQCFSFDITNRFVSVFAKSKHGKKKFLGQYNITKHIDAGTNAVSPNTPWAQREYVQVSQYSFKPVRDYVKKNALPVSVFDGEFLYTVTTVASHDNVPVMAATGRQTTYESVLEFRLVDDYLMLYRKRDLQNTSDLEDLSPIARYPATYFNIERSKTPTGEETSDMVEDTNCERTACKYVRVNFTANEIQNYFIKPTSISVLLGPEYGGFNYSKARLASNVKVESDLISFDTEESLTPSAFSGGSGESGFEPLNVRFRHAFMKIEADDTYVPTVHDDIDFERFGFFRTTLYGLDENNQATDETVKQYANIFDVSNGKNIQFHLSSDFPEHLVKYVDKSIEIWNDTFEQALNRKNLVELVKDSGTRLGDPRYSRIQFVDSRAGGLLGYGPSVAHPETGKVFSAVTYVYRATEEIARKRAGEIYDYLEARSQATEEDSNGTVGEQPVRIARTDAPGVARTFELTDEIVGFLKPKKQKFATNKLISAIERNSSLDLFDAVGGGTSTFALLTANNSKVEAYAQAKFGSVLRKDNELVTDPSKAWLDKFGGFDAQNLVKSDKHAFGACDFQPEFSLSAGIRLMQSKPGISREAFIDRAISSYMINTIVHELGHNFGLRHNFRASTDTANFIPKYHQIDKDVIETRAVFTKKIAEFQANPENVELAAELEELAKRIEQSISDRDRFRSSSSMDYLKLFEGDITVPAPYDVAAIRYGYGQTLETDEGTIVTRSDLRTAAKELNLSNEFNAERAAAANLKIKAYSFCSDEHVQNDPACNRHDSGTSMTEIMTEAIDEYNNRFDMYLNRNGNRKFTGGGLGSSSIMMARQIFAEFLYKYITGGGNFGGDESPFSLQDYIEASGIGLSFLLELIATPEPGIYSFDNREDRFVPGRIEGARQVRVGSDVGKPLLPRWETFGSADRVVTRGMVQDKILALQAVAMTGFPAEKYQRAQLQDQYGIFPNFGQAVISTLAAAFSENLTNQISLVQDAKGELIARPATGEQGRDVEILVETPYWMQNYSLFMLAMNLNSGNQMRYDVYSDFRTSKDGTPTFPEGVKVREFSNTAGTIRYYVPQTRDNLSIAYLVSGAAAKADQDLQLVLSVIDELESEASDAILRFRTNIQTFWEALQKIQALPFSQGQLISQLAPLLQQAQTGSDESFVAIANFLGGLEVAINQKNPGLLEVTPVTEEEPPLEDESSENDAENEVAEDFSEENAEENSDEESEEPVDPRDEINALWKSVKTSFAEMPEKVVAAVQTKQQTESQVNSFISIIDQAERRLVDMKKARDVFAF